MASNGIRDRVAIVGMGCTNFGERWDKSMSDLLVDAATEAVASAHVDPVRVEDPFLAAGFPGPDPVQVVLQPAADPVGRAQVHVDAVELTGREGVEVLHGLAAVPGLVGAPIAIRALLDDRC